MSEGVIATLLLPSSHEYCLLLVVLSYKILVKKCLQSWLFLISCLFQKGGGTIDLEPCLTHTSAVEPTLAPMAVERTMTTRAAASVWHCHFLPLSIEFMFLLFTSLYAVPISCFHCLIEQMFYSISRTVI